MKYQDHIVIDPDVLAGKPIVKGTRLSVEFILQLLAQNWTHGQIIENYPGLTEADILACLEYAAAMLRNERVFPLSA